MRIAYCDGRRLRRLFMAGSRNVVVHRSELNRINVFPIPDGDTGTNLALTMSAMAEAADDAHSDSLSQVADRIAEAGVMGARGNSGMMFAHFFVGFAEGVNGCAQARAERLATALRHAVDSLYTAVEKPVEGTILTVIRELTEEAESIAGRVTDLAEFARRILSAARESLQRTPELLPALKEADVVDAGAKGFVRFLEGGVALLDEGHRLAARRESLEFKDVPNAVAAASFPEQTDRAFRYCTELLVRGDDLPSRDSIASSVASLGGSLIVTRAPSLAKIHIHTDEPQIVAETLAGDGAEVELIKSEDMRAQHREIQQKSTRPIGIVTDSTCDLPPEAIIEHDISIVPLTVMFGDQSYLDQIDISYEEFLEKLVDPEMPHPTTSQPAPADFISAFKRAAEGADEVVAVLLSGALSGTLKQGQSAASRFDEARIHVFDSRTASLDLGFQVLRAAELASQGMDAEGILAELDRVRRQSGVFVTVDTLDYLKRSGRVSRGRALLAGLLDLKPILTVDDDGAVVAIDRVRGREALIPRVVSLLRERIPERRERLRLGIVHVLCAATARRIEDELRRELDPDEVWIRPAAAVLAAHTGPGAWAAIYQYD